MPSIEHVAGIEIRVDGQPLDARLVDRVTEVTVHNSLLLPDSVTIKIGDPRGQEIDSNPLQLGADLEIRAGAKTDRGTYTTIFKGQIAAVEPQFLRQECIIGVRAYDKAVKLYRDIKSRTFQNQTATDIVSKIISEHGLASGTMDSTGAPYDFMQQDNETDADFILKLAGRHGFEFVVNGTKAHFRSAGNAASTETVELRWQDNLRSFAPRLSGMAQPERVTVRHQDPKTKEVIEATATPSALGTVAGVSQAEAAEALGGGTVLVADRVVQTQSEAEALAQSTMNTLADTFIEAEGTAEGNPRIVAGSRVKIANVGSKFSGTYIVTETRHVYRSRRDYETFFSISGRSSSTLLDVISARRRHNWGNQLVVGIVTNNQDPDKIGRVRVRYPSLGDSTEGWWARIATISAGGGRGVLMLPVVGEEVIVGFEHGDTRKPYIIGSLFNGTEKPGEELAYEDGSFGLKSDKEVHIASSEEFTIKSDQKLTVTVKDDLKEEVGKSWDVSSKGAAKLSSKQSFDVEGQAVTIKGKGSISIESQGSLSLKGSMVDIKSDGVVNISGTLINLG